VTGSPPYPSAGGAVKFDNHTTGEPTDWAWSFGDGANSGVEVPQHVYSGPGTYTVTLTATNSHGSSSSSLTLDVSDPAIPPQADFTWIGEAPNVQDPVLFIQSSGGEPTSWTWDFGDGYHSNDMNPSHLYSLPGDHVATLEVSSGTGSSTVSKILSVAATTTDSMSNTYPDAVVAVAAATPGRHGTLWSTELTLHNTLDNIRWLYIYFLERGEQDNYSSPGTLINLLPRQTITVDDVVGKLFGLNETAGALLMRTSWVDLVTSRTLTENPDGGTYGQAVPNRDLRAMGPNHHNQVILGLRQDTSFRSNVGFVNVTSTSSSFTVAAFSNEGERIGEMPIELGRYGVVQIDNILKVTGGGRSRARLCGD
jgi:PKD repeat protein